MTHRRSFVRKIVYCGAIVVLLIPLSMLSMPSSAERQGGKLAKERKSNNLSQANLGEIDPASETMKLATLGMRGVAANILWNKAINYKKVEDWTNFEATLQQIANLQPNFISVWEYQSWNVSYNVSVQFDDYRDRYRWVIRGINYLKEGEEKNKNDPRLLWTLGWTISQKIGRSDEHVQFRKMFVDDDDFHPADRPRELRDNWLVGKTWYETMQDAINNKGKVMRGKSPHIYNSSPALCQINYAEALQRDGIHGQRAKIAWQKAAEEWRKYGSLNVLTSYGVRIRLQDQERVQEEARQLRAELDQILSGTREKLASQRFAALSPEQRKALETDPEKRTPEQVELANQAQLDSEVSHEDVALYIRDVSPDKGKQALRLAAMAQAADIHADRIVNYRQQVNYDYWNARCKFEQTDEALDARESIYKGAQALDEAKLLEAKRWFERGFEKWSVVFEQFPIIRDEGLEGEELIEHIVRYRRILDELDEPFPQDFILREVALKHDRNQELKGLFVTPDSPIKKPQDASDKTTDEKSSDKESPKETDSEGAKPEKESGTKEDVSEQDNSKPSESKSDKPAREKPSQESPKVEGAPKASDTKTPAPENKKPAEKGPRDKTDSKPDDPKAPTPEVKTATE